MSTETRKFKYKVALEWDGTVEVDVEDDDTESEREDYALDAAIDEALSSPLGFMVLDYTVQDVT